MAYAIFLKFKFWRPIMRHDVIYYQNKNVIARYCKEYNKSEEFANEVFFDLMKWLYVAKKCRDEGFGAQITSSLYEIDNMWHTFILFTRDYAQFCETYFNKFMHHEPNTSTNDEPRIMSVNDKIELKRYLDILVNEFGEKTMNVWYVDKKYAA